MKDERECMGCGMSGAICPTHREANDRAVIKLARGKRTKHYLRRGDLISFRRSRFMILSDVCVRIGEVCIISGLGSCIEIRR